MAEASAIVRLIKGSSFNGHGYSFPTKNVTRVITNPADIQFFERNQRFKVVFTKPAKGSKKPTPVAAAPPPPSTSPASNEEGEEEKQEPLPWRSNSKKADLLAAALSRNIAATSDDKAAVLVQLLKDHDDGNDPQE